MFAAALIPLTAHAVLVAAEAAAGAPPGQAHQEHAHHGATMSGALGDYPMTRDASGTSWQPDSVPHDMAHMMRGDWTVGWHGKGPIATTGIVSGREQAVDAFDAPSLFLDVAVNKGAAGADPCASLGVDVRTVDDDSPAARAGLIAGDFITAVDGVAFTDDRALRRIVARAPIGTSLRLSWRASEGQERKPTVVTEAAPDPP